MKLVYDLECNGFTPDTIWCIVAKDIDTNRVYTYSDHDDLNGTIAEGVLLLKQAELLIGHNIIGFDNRVVADLYGVDLNLITNCHDTFVMSQVLRYRRDHRHALSAWGQAIGNEKIIFDDFDEYSYTMLEYCIQDVEVNHEVYKRLVDEYMEIHKRNPLIKEGMQIEHDCARFNATVKKAGWKYDTEKAEETLLRMNERMDYIDSIMQPKLGMRTVYVDKEPRKPIYKKNGDFNHHTCKYLSEILDFEVNPQDTHLWPADKTFQRCYQEQIELGSMDIVKLWLLDHGWKPDEYQKKKVNGRWVQTSPKFTTASLLKLGEVGELVDEFYTLRSRRSIIEGWQRKAENGRLHGNMWTIGTPTFRCRHEVIVNLPAVSAVWGKEIRELLIAEDGHIIVGADSSGNQLRGLCHYVDNADFTNEVIYGDQHQRNADALGCSRPVAKEYLYAYLFGAGDGLLGQILTGKISAKVGKQSRENFAKSIKGLEDLKHKLDRIWKQTAFNGNGYIPGLDGRPVFCPSEHQLLNYLLQSAEGITCKAAISYQMEHIKKEGLRAEPRLFYHDESAWSAHKDDAKRVGEILQASFAEGPKRFGVDCMDGGDPMFGDSYAAVH